jgi:hypothetical protein
MATLFGRRWHFYYPYHLSYFAPGTWPGRRDVTVSS